MGFFKFIFQDWKSNRGNPKGRIILLLFRIANFFSTRRLYYYMGLPYLIFYRILVEWFFGIEIPWNVKVGKNFKVYHGHAIVLNAGVTIGENCNLRHCTTLGNKQLNDGTFSVCPNIGDNVDIGSNVCIIGPIRIGNNVTIGAGTIITKDIADDCVVVGNPGRVIKMKGIKI